jgi:hypothetical protein
MHTKDSTNHLDDAHKEETMQLHRHYPSRRPALVFPPVFEAGKNEQHHDDASKEVMAPVGIAIVRTMQGFHPSHIVDSTAIRHAARSHLWNHH